MCCANLLVFAPLWYVAVQTPEIRWTSEVSTTRLQLRLISLLLSHSPWMLHRARACSVPGLPTLSEAITWWWV
jgi:hypothetical protein